MLTRDYILEKIKFMPDDLVKEVGDFIDFLELKRQMQGNSRQRIEEERDLLAKSDMGSYLTELTAYEDRLARGEIDWK
ncbi:MAG: DUF2281 domain-containing protein [Dehalococcoidia bacterium]|nr:hypothetical protein [Chloroflexota bacterium]MBT9161096.1 hypothetical protein [Chloroflexota bacterium]MBT9162831.1 hypothetical protein [Chloroflexota bacterium]